MTSLALVIRFVIEACSLHVMNRPRAHIAFFAALFLLLAFLWLTLAPPAGFPAGRVITVDAKLSALDIAGQLKRQEVIRSADAFRVLARLTGDDRRVQAGPYLFAKPVGVLGVLSRLARGESGVPSARVTFPEGTSVREMGDILAAKFEGFDASAWDEAAEPYEGFLFPDTYDIPLAADVNDIIERLRANFDARMRELRDEAASRGADWNDVITMASIIEEEAATPEDRRIVSGILWSRIDHGVALQVDATFGYIRGITGYVPAAGDKDLDSPYNTYQNRGLPPGPITNPGIDAIDAALHPTETDYFYYLTGKDGRMRYAETFEEHKRNRENYLD